MQLSSEFHRAESSQFCFLFCFDRCENGIEKRNENLLRQFHRFVLLKIDCDASKEEKKNELGWLAVASLRSMLCVCNLWCVDDSLQHFLIGFCFRLRHACERKTHIIKRMKETRFMLSLRCVSLWCLIRCTLPCISGIYLIAAFKHFNRNEIQFLSQALVQFQ